MSGLHFPHTFNADLRCTWCDIRPHTAERLRVYECPARWEEEKLLSEWRNKNLVKGACIPDETAP